MLGEPLWNLPSSRVLLLWQQSGLSLLVSIVRDRRWWNPNARPGTFLHRNLEELDESRSRPCATASRRCNAFERLPQPLGNSYDLLPSLRSPSVEV